MLINEQEVIPDEVVAGMKRKFTWVLLRLNDYSATSFSQVLGVFTDYPALLQYCHNEYGLTEGQRMELHVRDQVELEACTLYCRLVKKDPVGSD